MNSITPAEMLQKLGVSLTKQEVDSITGIQVTIYKDHPPEIDFQGSIKLPKLIEKNGRWIHWKEERF